MSAPSESNAADRLAQALAAFRKAQRLVVATNRNLQDLPREEADKFWAGTGERLEQHQRACATEVMAAYRLFSAEGGVAVARDRRLVNEAYEVLVGSSGDTEATLRISLEQRNAEFQVSRRLRLAIEAELERRGISDPSKIAAIVGTSSKKADRLLSRRAWKEGDLALFQVAAAKLGLTV